AVAACSPAERTTFRLYCVMNTVSQSAKGGDVDNASNGIGAIEGALRTPQNFDARNPPSQEMLEVRGYLRACRVRNVDAVVLRLDIATGQAADIEVGRGAPSAVGRIRDSRQKIEIVPNSLVGLLFDFFLGHLFDLRASP